MTYYFPSFFIRIISETLVEFLCIVYCLLYFFVAYNAYSIVIIMLYSIAFFCFSKFSIYSELLYYLHVDMNGKTVLKE